MKTLASLFLLSLVLLLLGCSPIRLTADNDIVNQPSLINQIDKTDNTTMTVISMNIAH